MGLRDPDLELLLERLDDEPGDPVYLKVAEELVRRSRGDEAVAVLSAGIRERALPGASELLARVLLEVGRPDEALSLLDSMGSGAAPGQHPSELEQVRVLALEQSGATEAARAAALALLMCDSRDPFPKAVLTRLATPRPSPGLRGADPHLTGDRAEQFASIGRPDRALRIYRRLEMAHPNDVALRVRIEELARITRGAGRREPVAFGGPSSDPERGTTEGAAPAAAPWEAGLTMDHPVADFDEEEVTLVEQRPNLAQVLQSKNIAPRRPRSIK